MDRWIAGAVVDGRYELLPDPKEGEHARVWRAQDLDQGGASLVVIKQLKGGPSQSPKDRERKLGRLKEVGSGLARCPHVVRRLAYGEWEGCLYVVMECLEGETLAELLQRQPGGLPEDEVQRLALPLCDAVEEMHAANITHNDIKPENFMRLKPGAHPDRPVLIAIDLESALYADQSGPDGRSGMYYPSRFRDDVAATARVVAALLTGDPQFVDLPRTGRVANFLPRAGQVSRAVRSVLEKEHTRQELKIGDFRRALAPPKTALTGTLLAPPPAAPASMEAVRQAAMVRVPDEGDFIFGSGDVGGRTAMARNLLEAKHMRLPEFQIARTLVTNQEYYEFLNAPENRNRPVPFSRHPLCRPYNWNPRTREPNEKLLQHPVVLVTWYDASEYAKWRGLALPEEEQWEKAARGVDGRRYPWGNDWDPNLSNNLEAWLGRRLDDEEDWEYWMMAQLYRVRPVESSALRDGGLTANVMTTEVCQYGNGASPYGALDMAGNVWEWTATKNAEGYFVLRGGCCLEGPEGLRTYARIHERPQVRLPWVGFRCVTKPRAGAQTYPAVSGGA